MTDTQLDSLRGKLLGGDLHAARREIEQVVVTRRTESGGHAEWGLLCEDAGLVALAFTEFQLALRDDRDDERAAFRLAQHYRERGDSSRAAGLLEQLLDKSPANEIWLGTLVDVLSEDGAEPRALEAIQRAVGHGLPDSIAAPLRRRVSREPERDSATAAKTIALELAPTEADCIRFHTLFSGREGVYARQWVKPNGEGGYSPIQEPLTPTVVRNHLLGNYTVGVYVLRLDATATFFALDLDIDKQALQRARGDHAYAQSLRDTLRKEGPRLLNVLRDLGFQPVFENSGYKGRHYWVFLEQPESAETLHLLGRLLLAWQSPLLAPGLHLEFFPKQGSFKGKGLGNLIKLPLGIHRRTGHRSQFLDDQSTPCPDQLATLRSIRPANRETLYATINRLKTLPGLTESHVLPASGQPATSSRAVNHSQNNDRSPQDEQPPWREESPTAGKPFHLAPAPPARMPVWTEADFEADPRVRHLLTNCPVLSELKKTVDQHRRLTHDEQLVLIHSLGHIEGGPQAVNYLFGKCTDVGPEKLLKDRLKGNPVSCPSIRRKIPQLTRRVACNCPFENAKDRYPNPVLHMLTLPQAEATPVAIPHAADLESLARRFGVAERRRMEIQCEWEQLKEALVGSLRGAPDRSVNLESGRYRLIEKEGIEELCWEAGVTNAVTAAVPATATDGTKVTNAG